MTTTQINLRTLAAVSLMCSTEETRYYLNGVLVQCRADHVLYTATDGHRLVTVRDDYTADPATAETAHSLIGDFIIPLAVCRAFKPGKAKRHIGSFDLANMTQNGDELRLDGLAGTHVFKPIEGSFPDYARVIPAKITGKLEEEHNGKKTSVFYNPTYLLDFYKFADQMGFAEPNIGHNGGGPAIITFDMMHALGVLMPKRAAQHQSEIKEGFATARAAILGSPKQETAKAA